MQQIHSSKKRVLLVDDEPEITSGIVNALRRQPYVFIAVHSGQAALQVLAEQNIDVIVTDESMPGMSGVEFLARVKEKYPDIIRIMLTGHTDVQTAMNAIHEGWVYQYLTKPCNPVDLASSIYNALTLRSFLLPDEGPHMRMPAEEESELLSTLKTEETKR